MNWSIKQPGTWLLYWICRSPLLISRKSFRHACHNSFSIPRQASLGACAAPKIGGGVPLWARFPGYLLHPEETDGIWGGAPEASKMTIRGWKGQFYCIHRYFYLIFPKIGGGGTSKGGGVARPNVAHRERTCLVIHTIILGLEYEQWRRKWDQLCFNHHGQSGTNFWILAYGVAPSATPSTTATRVWTVT